MSKPSQPRVVAIIQARMGSTRLPGKVLMDIAGKPLLWHIIHRLREAATIGSIAVATSTHERDNPISDFCREENVTCIRGPEDNVLERFALAASRTKADIIVRVCSDSPFVDAPFVDHLVKHLIENEGDFVMIEPGAPCAHEGVDPFSRRGLDVLMREAANDPVAREHVTGYFKLHPECVKIVHAPAYAPLAHEGTRLSIDTPDDLAFVEEIYSRLEAKAGEASLSDLLQLLAREPRLKSINGHVRQKKLVRTDGHALIRCDGGGTFGYGHVRRSLAIARALRDREGFGVSFALNGDDITAGILRGAGFQTRVLPSIAQTNTLATLIDEKKPDILICDARQNLTRQALERVSRNLLVTAVIDDSSERRLAATHAYYPPVPQTELLSWKDSSCQVQIGWQWSVLGFDPTEYRNQTAGHDPARPRIVVTMGGSDPFDLTRVTARALAKITAPFTAYFVIGPGFRGPVALVRSIQALSPNFHVVEGLSELGSEFSKADLALVAFGVTAYELAAAGVPALYLTISEDHSLSASAFETAGMGKIIGLARQTRAEDIARAAWKLLADEDLRHSMRTAGMKNIDGKGAERVAADLVAALESARQSKALSA